MANKVITVTDPSIVTNDTLLGYNNYSDQDGQLGTTMTPTEATNGKTITLSDGVVHEVTTKPVGTSNGEFSAVVSNAVTVDLTAPTEYKIVTNGPNPIEDKLGPMDSANRDKNSLLHTTNWGISIWAKSLESTTTSRTMASGLNISAIELKNDGDIGFRQTLLTEWSSTLTDEATSLVTLGSLNDGLLHKYEFIWTVGQAALRLIIDDIYDFGLADINPEAPTTTTALQTLGADSTEHAWEFEKMVIDNDGSLDTFNLNEGSGAETTSDTNGAVIPLTTLDAGGLSHINSVMWQSV